MPVAREPHDVASLRGAQAQGIGPRTWFVAGVLVSIAIAAVIVASFIAAVNANARVERLKSQGVAVIVTVYDCTGHIGGSGSNASGYTCYGTYRVHGVRYREVIGAQSTNSPVGTRLHGVADPSHLSTVELASAVGASSTSDSAYVIPIVCGVVFAGVALSIVRARRRRVQRVIT